MFSQPLVYKVIWPDIPNQHLTQFKEHLKNDRYKAEEVKKSIVPTWRKEF